MSAGCEIVQYVLIHLPMWFKEETEKRKHEDFDVLSVTHQRAAFLDTGEM